MEVMCLVQKVVPCMVGVTNHLIELVAYTAHLVSNIDTKLYLFHNMPAIATCVAALMKD